MKIKKEGTELQISKEQGIILTDDQQANLEKWEKLRAKKTPEEVAKTIDLMHQGYWAVLKEKVKGNQFMQTWLPYRLWPWDIFSFMVLGIAFFQTPHFSRRAQ
ncbi:MAG: hypothetical protein U5K51_16325 [Flavobacteriaceae bacterium]|nr:hypothetical protein [Flavobacteriaceae bacterium]